jgi:hypothetical protein
MEAVFACQGIFGPNPWRGWSGNEYKQLLIQEIDVIQPLSK